MSYIVSVRLDNVQCLTFVNDTNAVYYKFRRWNINFRNVEYYLLFYKQSIILDKL